MFTLQNFLILAIVVVITIIFFSLYKLVYFGKQVARGRMRLRQEHVMWVDRFFFFIMLAVVLIEFMVITKGGRWGDSSLFDLHGILVILFLFTGFGMRFIWRGIRYPRTHRVLSKFFLLFFSGMAMTGGILFFQIN